jgi:hypothetical protein
MVLLLICIMVWIGIIVAQFQFPTHSPDMQWIATILWCIETFPQLWLNAQLGQASGQSTLSVAMTVGGKTTDTLSAFLVEMPLQTRVLCFFSTATAYIDALQVMWYLWSNTRADDVKPRHETLLNGARDVGHKQPLLSSLPAVNEETNTTEQTPRFGCDDVLVFISATLVVCLIGMLVMFTFLLIVFPVSVLLVVSEAICVTLCMFGPGLKFDRRSV